MAVEQDPRAIVPLLEIGPYGGVDTTTDPLYLAPQNFVDSRNFVPNDNYGGFKLTLGRINALFGTLPSVPNGMHCFKRQGQPDVYFFAVDVPTAAQKQPFVGELYYAQLGQAPQPLTLPQSFTAGQPTKFVDAQSWCFVTNGVDTPVKIDTDLNVTNWGIAAPTTAPTVATAGPGVLNGTYYYCTTYGNDVQESSQGTITAALTFTTANATGSFKISGTMEAFKVLYFTAGNIGGGQSTTTFITLPNSDGSVPSVYQVASAFAAAITADPLTSQFVTAQASTPSSDNLNEASVVLTASVAGSAGNSMYFFADKSPDNTISVEPKVQTLLLGGADGQTPKLTNFPVSTDPQVTQLNLYRLGGSLGTWNLITTLTYGPNFPPFYEDFTADSDVTGQELVVNRDAPPAFSYIAFHQERVWGFGVNPCANTNGTIAADPSVAWWSNINEPWGFNAADNTLTCGDNKLGDVAMGMMEMGGVLAMNKSNRLYWMYGTTDSDFQSVFAFFVGTQAPLSLAVGYGMGFWLSRQGVHYTDGQWYYNISDGGYQQSNIKTFLDGLSDTDRAQAVGFIFDRQYWLSFPTQGLSQVFDIRTRAWYPVAMSTPQAVFNLDTGVPVVGAGELQNQGQVLQWFASTQDLGIPITGTITSKLSDAGGPQSRKQLRYGIVEAPVQPGVEMSITTLANPSSLSQLSDSIDLDLGFSVTAHRWSMAVPTCTNLQVKLAMTSSVGGEFQRMAAYGWVKSQFSPGDEEPTLEAGPLVGRPVLIMDSALTPLDYSVMGA